MSRKTKKTKLAKKRQLQDKPKLGILRTINKFTVLSLSICAISTLVFIYLKTSASSKIAGSITKFGDVELQYGTDQKDGFSPLCGCWIEKKAEEWRGISFVARQIQIERKGVDPVTAYNITYAFPDHISWTSPGLFKLRAKVFSIVVPTSDSFLPELLMKGQLPSTQRIVEEKDIDATDSLMLVTKEGKLNITLLGNTPLGSWIPIRNSKTTIKYEPGMHLNSEGLASIEETYAAYPPSALHLEDDHRLSFDESIEYPLGDFLGPNVVLWSEDRSAYITTLENVLFHESASSENSRRITAIVVADSAFSVRVACQPFGENEIEKHIKDSRIQNVILPTHVRDSGTIKIDIRNPKTQALEFDSIYKLMKSSPTVEVKLPCACNIYEPNTITDEVWGFRYPPVPPDQGFNIFGPISNLKLTSATGKILVGSRTVDIEAPSSLELRNIKSLEVEGGVITVPIRLKSGENQADFQLQATSEAYVNDESINKKADEYKSITEYLLLVSAIIPILSFLASIASMVLNRR